MSRRKPGLLELLVASVLVLLAGLLGQVGLMARSSTALAHVDRLIVDDAAPSVVALESASAKLGELQGLLRDRLRAPIADHSLVDEDIAAKRRELGDAIAGYYELPVDPGELAVRVQIDKELEGLDRVVARVLHFEDGAPPQPEALVRTLEDRVTGLDRALLTATTINAEVLTRTTASLRTVRTWVLPSAIGLELLCIIAAALTLAAAYRLVRAAEESHAASRRMLEQRMNELDAFSGRVAHDLLSPLMTVSLAIGAAEPCLTAPEHRRARAMVSRAGASLQRVRETVGDLLDFARAGAAPAPSATASAGAVIDAVVDEFAPLAEAASIELRVEGDSARHVQCSAGVLRSVLGNLVQNAIKYLDGGLGRRITMRVADAGPDLRFEVEDTGPGIRPDVQRTIFDPYVRCSDAGAGLGLGLATVKRLAEAHGGQVGVCSELGRGACFWVTLPGAA